MDVPMHALAVVVLAGGLLPAGAQATAPPPADTVTVRGCVLHGEHFGPVEASVTVRLPERGQQRVVRSDRAGRFALSAPRHARLVLTVAPLALPIALPLAFVDPTSQTLELTTGRTDISTDGCLVVW